MVLYVTARTELTDIVIDYIEVKLAAGETVSLNWDESSIERNEDGFNARYKGVYFGDSYANSCLKELSGMRILMIGVYTEENDDSALTITRMLFEDAGAVYEPKDLPYRTRVKECDLT